MLGKLAVCAALFLGGEPPEGDWLQIGPDKFIRVLAAQEKLELLPIELNIIKYTNAARVRNSLQPLRIDGELMKSAREHAAWMANSRRMVHTSRPVAENIAAGQRHSREAVRDWMHSRGHRQNILNAGHERIGAAAYRSPNGRIYWCQQFSH